MQLQYKWWVCALVLWGMLFSQGALVNAKQISQTSHHCQKLYEESTPQWVKLCQSHIEQEESQQHLFQDVLFLSQALFFMGQKEQAIQVIDNNASLVKDKSQKAQLINLRGDVYQLLKQNNEALKNYEEALELVTPVEKSNSKQLRVVTDFLVDLAEVKIKQKQYDEAKSYLERANGLLSKAAIHKTQQYAPLHREWSNLYLKTGQRDKAVEQAKLYYSSLEGNLGNYMGKMRHQIGSNWHPLSDLTIKKSDIQLMNDKKSLFDITLTKEGKLVDLRLVNPSSSKELDEYSESIIRKAAPFPPLPNHVKDYFVKIPFVFGYAFPETRSN